MTTLQNLHFTCRYFFSKLLMPCLIDEDKKDQTRDTKIVLLKIYFHDFMTKV